MAADVQQVLNNPLIERLKSFWVAVDVVDILGFGVLPGRRVGDQQVGVVDEQNALIKSKS